MDCLSLIKLSYPDAHREITETFATTNVNENKSCDVTTFSAVLLYLVNFFFHDKTQSFR